MIAWIALSIRLYRHIWREKEKYEKSQFFCKQPPFRNGEVTTATIGRLAVTACLLLLLWGLGWLDESGVTRLGHWLVWLLALIGMLYFASVSLYSFYGKVAFDFTSLMRLPDSRTLVLTHFWYALVQFLPPNPTSTGLSRSSGCAVRKLHSLAIIKISRCINTASRSRPRWKAYNNQQDAARLWSDRVSP